MPNESSNSATSQPLASTRTKTVFEEFLLAEYNNIAQAHFNTVTSISEFFKHYIVIVSLPISVAVIFLKPSEPETSSILDVYPLLLPILLVLVTLVGLTVLGYVVNLRFDAILYARTVNGIRKYFSESSGHSTDEEARFLVLPTSTHFPLYIESGYFLFVVLTFAIVGTAYFFGGLYLYWQLKKWAIGTSFWFLVGSCAWVHLFLYAFLGRQRDRGYLRGPVIGVDIDGVLNDHRTHFAKVLKDQTGKDLDPALIIKIPVRQIPNANIEEKDEHAVFNWPSYWTDMPPLKEAAKYIKNLQGIFGCRIWIFTHRPWPQPKGYPMGEESSYRSAWMTASWWAIPSQWRLTRAIEDRLAEWGVPGPLGGKPIKKITKQWLHQHGFKYNRLIVERLNTDTTDELFFTINRFSVSKQKQIRIFVEDDLSKAKKLTDFCTIVFLIDHPYNRVDPDELPRNVLRVKSWPEIYEFVNRGLLNQIRREDDS